MERRELPRWYDRLSAKKSAERLHEWKGTHHRGNGGIRHGAEQGGCSSYRPLQHAKEF